MAEQDAPGSKGRLLFTDFEISDMGRPAGAGMESVPSVSAAVVAKSLPTLNDIKSSLDIGFESDEIGAAEQEDAAPSFFHESDTQDERGGKNNAAEEQAAYADMADALFYNFNQALPLEKTYAAAERSAPPLLDPGDIFARAAGLKHDAGGRYVYDQEESQPQAQADEEEWLSSVEKFVEELQENDDLLSMVTLEKESARELFPRRPARRRRFLHEIPPPRPQPYGGIKRLDEWYRPPENQEELDAKVRRVEGWFEPPPEMEQPSGANAAGSDSESAVLPDEDDGGNPELEEMANFGAEEAWQEQADTSEAAFSSADEIGETESGSDAETADTDAARATAEKTAAAERASSVKPPDTVMLDPVSAANRNPALSISASDHGSADGAEERDAFYASGGGAADDTDTVETALERQADARVDAEEEGGSGIDALSPAENNQTADAPAEDIDSDAALPESLEIAAGGDSALDGDDYMPESLDRAGDDAATDHDAQLLEEAAEHEADDYAGEAGDESEAAVEDGGGEAKEEAVAVNPLDVFANMDSFDDFADDTLDDDMKALLAEDAAQDEEAAPAAGGAGDADGLFDSSAAPVESAPPTLLGKAKYYTRKTALKAVSFLPWGRVRSLIEALDWRSYWWFYVDLVAALIATASLAIIVSYFLWYRN